MKAFMVKGKFLMGDRWQGFTKEVVGKDEIEVAERIYSVLGSKHRVKRAKIQILEVQEIPPNKLSDPLTKYQLKSEMKSKKEDEKGEING